MNLRFRFAWMLSRLGVVCASACIALGAVALERWVGNEWLEELEERASDAIWKAGADRKDERRLIIVDIDEKSLASIGPWPWPRGQQALLIDKIAEAGAGLQVLDIVFPDASGNGEMLANAFSRHRPVLAQVFAMEAGPSPTMGQLAGTLDWPSCPPPFSGASGYVANAEMLTRAVAVPVEQAAARSMPVAGHITPRVARDGLVRQQPAVVCYSGRSYPALGLAALMHATSEQSLVLQRGAGWWEPHWWLSGRSQTLPPVPLSSQGDIRIPWRHHPDSFISISAAEVLAGHVPQGLLSNAWVLVGSSAFGLNDTIATPFGGVGAGMLVHAQLLTALVDGQVPYTPRIAPYYQMGTAVLGFGLLVLLSCGWRRFPPYLIAVSAGLWAVALLISHGWLQLNFGLWMGWVSPSLFVLVGGLSLGGLEHARSRVDRDRLFTHLSSYLPAPVAAALAVQSPSGAIKASTKQVSVLFADIRNFSAYCEARPPEEAAAVLHAFFSLAARVVESHGGLIESFQGDAVIAVWNAEGSGGRGSAYISSDASPAHPRQALAAAMALQQKAREVLPDPAPAGLEPLALGIGVETGPAMSGSFGPASRRTHMVMGRTVTIASRLVSMTADLAHPILVGEGLAGHVGGVGLESMGTFLLDGLRVPHHVYAAPYEAAEMV